ncbi:hypothetical protein [uncultured Thiodictyon sp.]|uniref:hypothetical protein n=1 Tax=uncultured Thiodictyon sp. TaxID=1846217 RepID=UPI0025F21651|nr:hypothetical protein [uncultured Thiodictyon sp.]
MIDQKTEFFSLPLPHPDNDLAEDVGRLRESISRVDGLIKTQSDLTTSDDPAGLGHMQAVVDNLGTLNSQVGTLTSQVSGFTATLPFFVAAGTSAPIPVTINGR